MFVSERDSTGKYIWIGSRSEFSYLSSFSCQQGRGGERNGSLHLCEQQACVSAAHTHLLLTQVGHSPGVGDPILDEWFQYLHLKYTGLKCTA